MAKRGRQDSPETDIPYEEKRVKLTEKSPTPEVTEQPTQTATTAPAQESQPAAAQEIDDIVISLDVVESATGEPTVSTTATAPAQESQPAVVQEIDDLVISLDVVEPATGEPAGSTTNCQEEDLYDDVGDDVLHSTDTATADATLIGSDKVTVKVKEVDTTTIVSGENDAPVIVSSNDTSGETVAASKAQEEKEAEEKKTIAANALQYSKSCLGLSLQTNFEHVPGLQYSLGLNGVGDNVSAEFWVNGVKLEVSLKVVEVQDIQQNESPVAEHDTVGIDEKIVEVVQPTTEAHTEPAIDTAKAQNALRNAAPLSGGPLSANALNKTPCKFGARCTKGDSCLFDHSGKDAPKSMKLCTWVNRPQGCTNARCQYTHDHQGVKCNKSKLRSVCINSFNCAYKHDDDEVEAPKQPPPKASKAAASAAQKAALARASREASSASHLSPVNDNPPPSYAPPQNAPTGPKNSQPLSKVAGQKRGRNDEGEDEDHGTQRLRKNSQLPDNPDLQQQNFEQQNYEQQDFGYTQNGQYNNGYNNGQYNGQYNNGQYNNGYQGGHQWRGRGGGQGRGRGRGRGRGNGNGRGNANGGGRGNRQNIGGAQNNAPQADLKIRGVAAQHNP